MNEEQLLKILESPYVSEKAEGLKQHRQYTFRVLPGATKPTIKKAIEYTFHVRVEAVRLCNIKRHGLRRWKKAYVTLAAGQEIDMGAERGE
ncbi:MAG: 50S ribosomal protein L23 [Coxiella sp. RIFCSPHIGHO2_12_FULL_44_14]|nr:MAG: 50S ribosomal protein L23 [Coxiella sp. RIFCSPHIGHO2_12_FULL_44_14]